MREYQITDDLSSAKQGDWIAGVGDISTKYEEDFVRRFAEAIQATKAGDDPE
jgi:hypothetical protein